MNDEEIMLTSKQTAELCGVTLNTLQKWRTRGNGPKYVKFGGANSAAVRYPRKDVEAFIQARTVNPLS
jgi:predicted DNA-binding transcriptional regulator AlpA